MRIIVEGDLKGERNETFTVCPSCGCVFAYVSEDVNQGTLDFNEGGYPYAFINCPYCNEYLDTTYELYEED